MTHLRAILRTLRRWFSNEGQHPQGCDCATCVDWQQR
jgi:hypothetical protein